MGQKNPGESELAQCQVTDIVWKMKYGQFRALKIPNNYEHATKRLHVIKLTNFLFVFCDFW